ncbi:MAG: transglutaminase-like domain-containing protein [Planctomycetia bacterium]|nr:transglutaminase-like domain-containing protein [Planctomycetia bacterium]
MDTAAIIAKFGRHQTAIALRAKDYGLWFQAMANYAALSDERLRTLDIGALNLLAALELPGAERVKIHDGVQKLNSWAAQVRVYTQDRWNLFERSPEQFANSPGQFRMMAMVTFLQKRLDVHYNLSFSEGDYDGTDSRNHFLHGILTGHGGTCVSLPVLYIAIGRRLAYPLFLVHAKEHYFARWDEPGGERFNIECTSPGFRAPSDEYFHSRPRPLNTTEIESGCYLTNLRPREELAAALCSRAVCLMENLRPAEALQSCCLAGKLALEDQDVRGLWSKATVMANALEAAKKSGGLENYAELDLRRVEVPDGNEFFERWAAPLVREDLQRLAYIRDRKIARTNQMLIREFHSGNHTRFSTSHS